MPRFLKKVALAAGGVVIALLLVEVVLRVAGPGRIVPTLQFDVHTQQAIARRQFAPDPDLFWRLAPGGLGPADSRVAAIRPEAPVPPKTGRRRILILGDSCSRLSYNGPPYSVLLQDSLGADRAEVLNAAVPGYTSYQGLVWLRRQLLASQPDVVVVYYGWNDHWRSTGLSDRDRAGKRSPWQPRLLDLVPRHGPAPLRVPLEEFRRNLADIARLTQQAGGRVVFVTPPGALTPEATARLAQSGYLSRGDDAVALHAAYQQAVRAVAATAGARVFDAARLFTTIGEPRRLLFRDGIHPTDLGYRVVATGLARMIEAMEGARAGEPWFDQTVDLARQWIAEQKAAEQADPVAPGGKGAASAAGGAGEAASSGAAVPAAPAEAAAPAAEAPPPRRAR